MNIHVIAHITPEAVLAAAVTLTQDNKIDVLEYEKEELSNKGAIQYGIIRDYTTVAFALETAIGALKNRLNNHFNKVCTIKKCYVSLHPYSCVGEIITESRHTDVTKTFSTELNNVMVQAAKVSAPENRVICTLNPTKFILNGKEYDYAPFGMEYNNLDIKYQSVVVNESVYDEIENIATMTNNYTIEFAINPNTLQYLATKDERNEGCAIICLDNADTTILDIENGEIKKMCVIPIGIDTIASDISTALEIAPSLAKQLTDGYLRFDYQEIPSNKVVQFKRNGKTESVNYAHLTKVMHARMFELITTCKTFLTDNNEKNIASNILLCGAVFANKNAANITNFISQTLHSEVIIRDCDHLLTDESKQYKSPNLAKLITMSYNEMQPCVTLEQVVVTEPVEPEPEKVEPSNKGKHKKSTGWSIISKLFDENAEI